MLRVANQLKAISPIPIKITFLGAHALLPEFKSNSQGYIDQIIREMLPVIGAETGRLHRCVLRNKLFFSFLIQINLHAGSREVKAKSPCQSI